MALAKKIAPTTLDSLYEEIVQKYTPNNGWCNVPECPGCRDAALRISVAKEAARHGWNSRGEPTVDSIPESIGREIYNSGYSEGYGTAHAEASSAIQDRIRIARQEAEATAKSYWYERGVRDGKSSSSADEKEIRSKLMDRVFQECKVIGESNPQMEPAMNALRHRLKKI